MLYYLKMHFQRSCRKWKNRKKRNRGTKARDRSTSPFWFGTSFLLQKDKLLFCLVSVLYGPVGAGLTLDQADDNEIHGCHEQQKNDGGHVGPQHAAGIVHPMKENRGQIGKEQVNPAGGKVPHIIAAPGPAVEEAHEHGEAQVPGDRQDRSGQGHGQAVLEDIQDVFKSGKAQGYKSGVDDAVKPAVEIGVTPGFAVEEQVFHTFLRGRDNEKREIENIIGAVRRDKGAKQGFPDHFQYGSSQRGQHAPHYQAQQQQRRLLLNSIVDIDVAHQKECRKQGGSDIDDHQVIDRQGKENQTIHISYLKVPE